LTRKKRKRRTDPIAGCYSWSFIVFYVLFCPLSRSILASPVQSNPTKCVEGEPKNMLAWSDNTAIIATGTYFEPTETTRHVSKYERTISTRYHTQCSKCRVGRPPLAAVARRESKAEWSRNAG
jgi:hypothetical protein